jgi:hypothetical protein
VFLLVRNCTFFGRMIDAFTKNIGFISASKPI